MREYFLRSVCVFAVIASASPVLAQSAPAAPAPASEDQRAQADNEIIVTATRREERLQDVPISISAFQQAELTEKGIVGFEGIARETPGVVLNRPTQNFNNFTARGLATNGYNANLQSSVAVYIDELPVSTIGNTTLVDPNLFDVERVEFLRGPQGTLFGSGSLSGAMRILTKSPDLDETDWAAVVDFGLTGSDSFRQRYNAMVNVPIVNDRLALRTVGFYRNEDGYLDNVGTGIRNSNSLINYGGRAILLWEPSSRFSVRLLGSYENSDPKDSSLTSPALGRNKRISDQPDRFTGKQTILNATVEYEFPNARLTSSTTYSDYDQRFWVDLAGTFAPGSFPGAPIAFGLDADAFDKVYVQEARVASTSDGPLQYVIGGFYLNRRRDVDYLYRSSPQFLAARNLRGLPDQYYQKMFMHFLSEEAALFGELTYRFSDQLWVTGGLRYGQVRSQAVTEPGGYLATAGGFNYFTYALFNIPTTFTTFTPYALTKGVVAKARKPSWKASISYKPSDTLTTYATFATGFRGPIVNGFAGRASLVQPSDIIIPPGASSDDLKSYELGAKGRWLDGRLSLNAAVFWIDWSNIQAQANRVSDSVQFATNIGAARSRGLELEGTLKAAKDFDLGFNAAFVDAKITELTPAEAAISGAVLGHRLSAPRFQGSAYASYSFDLADDLRGTLSFNLQHVGAFNSSFPNTPGAPNRPLSTFGRTDAYQNVNASFRVRRGDWAAQLYVENFLDDDSVTYIHPEAFIVSRFGTLRPRTFGIRISRGL